MSLFENVADLIFTVNLAGLKELKKFVAFQLLNRIKLVFKVVLITVCKNLCLNITTGKLFYSKTQKKFGCRKFQTKLKRQTN